MVPAIQSERDSRGVMKKVVFACVHNAGRSQMAAAFFNHLADPSQATAVSAGTEPADRVHPVVAEAMEEVGIALTAKPVRLTEELVKDASMLITMGCGEQCPYVPGLARDDWKLEDPKGKPLDRVRLIREQVRDRVTKLLEQMGFLRV